MEQRCGPIIEQPLWARQEFYAFDLIQAGTGKEVEKVLITYASGPTASGDFQPSTMTSCWFRAGAFHLTLAPFKCRRMSLRIPLQRSQLALQYRTIRFSETN